MINTVDASIKVAKKDGDTAVITVNGENLPEVMYYDFYCTNRDDEMTLIKEKETVSTKFSTDRERTFEVKIPPVSEYPKASEWTITVYPSKDDEGTPVTIAAEREVISPETWQILQSEIKEFFRLKEADYTPSSWKAYSAAIRAAQNMIVEASEAEGQAALKEIKDAKAVLKMVATEETRTKLQEAIDGYTQLKEADYTPASWKAYMDAIEAAKIIAEATEVAETDCQTAIKAINDAKAALVTNVKPVNKVTKIKISGISKKIAAGKKIQLTASVAPSNASNKAILWTSSNRKYATVDSNGKVTIKKAGAGKSVTITASAADGSGVKATYKIQIKKNAVKSIKLQAKKTVKAGKSLKVKANVKTTGKKVNKTLKWTSSNSKYATVSSKGVVKAKKAGKGHKVKITASATDGSGKKKTVTIKIK